MKKLLFILSLFFAIAVSAQRSVVLKIPAGTDTSHLSARINLKVNISDTAAMLSVYAKLFQIPSITGKVNISDTAAMLANYKSLLIALLADSATIQPRFNLRVAYSDTATMLSIYRTAIISLVSDSSYQAAQLALKIKYTDSASMLNAYRLNIIALISDTTTIQTRLNLKVNIGDTANMLVGYKTFYPRASLSAGTGISYNPVTGVITNTGVAAAVDTVNTIESRFAAKTSRDSVQNNLDSALSRLPNLYQQKLTVTTTGTSGPSTLINGVFNIPQYAAGSIFDTTTLNLQARFALDMKYGDTANLVSHYARDFNTVHIANTEFVSGMKLWTGRQLYYISPEIQWTNGVTFNSYGFGTISLRNTDSTNTAVTILLPHLNGTMALTSQLPTGIVRYIDTAAMLNNYLLSVIANNDTTYNFWSKIVTNHRLKSYDLRNNDFYGQFNAPISVTASNAYLIMSEISNSSLSVGAGFGTLSFGSGNFQLQSGSYKATFLPNGTHSYSLPGSTGTLALTTDTSLLNLAARFSNDVALANSKQSAITTGSTSQYFRGDLSLATFPTIPTQFNPIAGTNMTITGTYPNITFSSAGSGGTTFDTATLNLVTRFGNVSSALSTKQPTITTGSTGQYLRGDLSLATFPTIPTVPTNLSSFTNDLGNYGGWLTIGSKTNKESRLYRYDPETGYGYYIDHSWTGGYHGWRIQANNDASDVQAYINNTSVDWAYNADNATNATNATTASAVAWTGVTGRPTSLSQFTNNLGNYGGWITGINSGMVTSALGYTPYNSTNPSNYISSITGSMVTSALGYTPQQTITTGSTSQYFRGDLSLATFPSIPAQFNPTAGSGISLSGSYPNITITNSSPSSGGTVTSVSGTAPISSSGGNTPAISISQATTSTNGYLSSTDWNTFNGKQAALGFTPYNSTNPSGYISGITGTMVNTALGYTPYNSSNPAGYISSYTETDPTIYAWAKASTKPSYAWTEITSRPTALSQFTNDLGNYGGFLTSAVTSLSGTTNQISVSGSTGSVTVSLPTNVTISGVMTSTGFSNSSDIRLKDIIDNDGDVYKYTFKDGRDNFVHSGYVAQYIKYHFPNQVYVGSDGYYSVNYTEIHTQKIRELENQVEALKNQVKVLIDTVSKIIEKK